MTIKSGDYVLGVRSADGQRVALGPLVPIASGVYCVKARTADNQIIAAGLKKLDKSGQVGIIARTADGQRVGLTPGGAISVWVINSSGSLVATYDTGYDTRRAVFSGANLLVLNGGSDLQTVRCFGSSPWSYTPSANLYGLDVDGSGNVYIGGALNASSKSIWKLDSSGSLLASSRPNVASYYADNIFDVMVVGSHVHCACSGPTGGPGTTQYFMVSTALSYESVEIGVALQAGTGAYGASDWGYVALIRDVYFGTYYCGSCRQISDTTAYNRFDTGANAADICGDGTNATLVGTRNASHSVWRFPQGGDFGSVPAATWTYDTGADTKGICIDGSGNVYVVGVRAGSASVWKLDPDGALVWSYDTGADTASVGFDGSGNIVVAGTRVGG